MQVIAFRAFSEIQAIKTPSRYSLYIESID